jgi:hypothetical protein
MQAATSKLGSNGIYIANNTALKNPEPMHGWLTSSRALKMVYLTLSLNFNFILFL